MTAAINTAGPPVSPLNPPCLRDAVTVVILRLDASLECEHGESAKTAFESWHAGPLPLPFRGALTDGFRRRTYLERKAADVVYGEDNGRHCRAHRTLHEGPVRWWRTVGLPRFRGALMLAAEYVEPSTIAPSVNRTAYLLLHLDVSGEGLVERGISEFVNFAGLGTPGDEDRAMVQALIGDAASLPASTREYRSRSTTISYARLPAENPPVPYPSMTREPREQWLHVLASGSHPRAFEPDVEELDEPVTSLSTSWRALVLRDGTSFIARGQHDRYLGDPEGDQPADAPFTSTACVLARTVYTDIVLLGLVQADGLRHLQRQLEKAPMLFVGATLSEQQNAAVALREVQHEVDAFTSRIWTRDATRHGHGDALLLAYQAQHDLRDQFDSIKSELADRVEFYASLSRAQAEKTLNRIAVSGFVISVVVGLVDLARSSGAGTALGATVAASILALCCCLVLPGVRPERGFMNSEEL